MMSKTISIQTDESRRMMSSWTLELANWLMIEKDLERRAFRSFAAWRLVEVMTEN